MISLLAATALAARLGAIDAIEYDRYASGRPRRVVAAYDADEESERGEVRLLRLPDDDRGKPRVLDRDACEAKIASLEVVRLVDEQDIVVYLRVNHVRAVVDRVRGDRIVRIADDYTSEWLVPDLDHDGVPEIISVGYIGRDQCGEENGIDVAWWNGTRYRLDKRRYRALATNDRGYEMKLSASKHYVVHLYGRGKALLDDEPMTPGKVFSTEDDCHVFAVQGAKGTWAFLEERP
jgi:hypothetical protein